MTSTTNRLRVALVAVAALAALAAVATAGAGTKVTVRLAPVDGWSVRGTVILTGVGAGTRAVLDVKGLPDGARAVSRLHAGTALDGLSASFAPLPKLRADEAGRARASGRILFQGREPVALADVADAEHVIVVALQGEVVAYGVVPAVG
jgi:hypothetical protein